MSVHKGSTKIKDIYYGSKKIARVYRGSTLLYEPAANEFYINASGLILSAYFLTGTIPSNLTTKLRTSPMLSGMNTYALPVTASTFTGSLTELNAGQTLYVYKGGSGNYTLVGSMVLQKGATYNLTF